MAASLTSSTMKRDFYLCYSDYDYDEAKVILQELEKRELTGYFEERDGGLGRTKISIIEEGLTNSRKVVLLVTKKSANKCEWHTYKMHTSLMNDIENRKVHNLIPVYWDLPKDNVPVCLNHLHGAEYCDSDYFWKKLADSVKRPA